MSETEAWTSISIRAMRKNGLRYMAAKKDGRTAGSMLDLVLEKAGVPNLTDSELEKKMEVANA